jgi:fatty-acyl-CoA synthase
MSDLASARPASRTLADLVDEMAVATPNAEALVFRDERLDYAVLKARVDVFARALLAVGIQRGDRVALLVTNRTEWVVGAFAAAKIGALVAAISTFSTPRELAWTLEHSGVAALITLEVFRGGRFLDALRDLCPELDRSIPGALRAKRLPSLRTVVAIDDPALAGVFLLPEFLAQGASVDAAALAATQQAVTPEDICYILYTSGLHRRPQRRDLGARAADHQWL